LTGWRDARRGSEKTNSDRRICDFEERTADERGLIALLSEN
jgi:hypothetical protein